MTRRVRWCIPLLAAGAVGSTHCSCERTNDPTEPGPTHQDASPDMDALDSSNSDDGVAETQTPDGEPDGGMAWLNNLAYWKPMPDAKQCEVYSADTLATRLSNLDGLWNRLPSCSRAGDCRIADRRGAKPNRGSVSEK